MENQVYDLLIIGGGSAALSAGIYAGRAMMDVVIIEKGEIGGQAVTTSDIVNYPGIRKTTGPNLMKEMYQQAQDFGVSFVNDEITAVDFTKDQKVVIGNNGKEYRAYAVIIATGASANKIGFKGEVEFTGRGIAYCATCDGEFFKGLEVYVVGGGYAAAEEAVYLTRYAKKVHMLIREPDFTCAKMTADQARNHPKIDVTYHTEVKEVSGDGLLQKAVLVNNQTGEETVVEADPQDGTFGMFIFAGNKPNTEIFKNHVQMSKQGFIPTNDLMETNVAGIYAVGDLREKELRQIVTAVSDGAIAATKAQQYVVSLKERLGLPITYKMAQPQQKTAEPTEKAAEKTQVKAAKSTWFPAEMQLQLKTIFAKLTKKVKIINFLDEKLPKSVELASFMQEFSTLSPKISFENIARGSQPELEKACRLTRFPVAVLLDEDNQYTGIKFSGIPSGHELNSLVLAVYNVGSSGQELSAEIKEQIQQLPATKIEICVSLTCHYCPDVVAACQHIAALNPKVEAEMIDTALFPELKQERKLMSVPAMIINDQKVVFGAKKLPEILEEIAAL